MEKSPGATMRAMHPLILLMAMLNASDTRSQEAPPFPQPPSDVSARAVITTPDEPGSRMVLRGTVFRADGTTPYPGFLLYLYQTDDTGVYNRASGSWREPRLRGWVKTDAQGKYEIRTIKPGSYPGSTNPAHIHVIVRINDAPPQWIGDFLFEGDPFLNDRDIRASAERGKFGNIIKLTRGKDGILTGVRDIRIGGN